MQVPPEITYIGVERTAALDDLMQKQVARLEKICDYIISVHIAVQNYTQRHRTGNSYRVRVDTRIPRKQEMVVKRVSVASRRFEPLPTVIRRAFESAERKLGSLVERQRNEVKFHPQNQVMAFVDKVFQEEGYGFLKSLDGRQIYFHKNSCLHREWERLRVGTGVRYTEEEGEKGPQATSLEIVDKPGARETHRELHELPQPGAKRHKVSMTAQPRIA